MEREQDLTTTSRQAYLAGSWYPATAAACTQMITEQLQLGKVADNTHSPNLVPTTSWRGLLVPHAGWIYSGRAAVATYQTLLQGTLQVKQSTAVGDPLAIDLVVLFGSHRGMHGPYTIFQGTSWQTPLGAVVTETELAGSLARDLALTAEPVRPAYPDNGAEIHLPYIKYFFPRAHLLMLGVGTDFRQVLEIGTTVGQSCLERKLNTVFIASSDLTHYGPNYDRELSMSTRAAVEWVREVNDQQFLTALLAGDPVLTLATALEQQSACCPGAVVACMLAVTCYRGLLSAAAARKDYQQVAVELSRLGSAPGNLELTALQKSRWASAPKLTGFKGLLVDHYLSYDIKPDASFVGYAGVVF